MQQMAPQRQLQQADYAASVIFHFKNGYNFIQAIINWINSRSFSPFPRTWPYLLNLLFCGTV